MILSSLKFLHILFAIAAVGFSASYIIWMRRAARNPQMLPYVLRGIRFLDSRFTNPCFGGLLLTGIIMVLVAGYRLNTLWIDAAVILFVLVGALGALVYAPTFRRLRLAAECGSIPPSELQALVDRATWINVLVGLLVLVILGLMVFKPSL